MFCERLSISLDIGVESGAGVALRLWTVVRGAFGLGGTVPYSSQIRK